MRCSSRSATSSGGSIQLLRQRLLWRVRQRLIVSYVFIGVVPALLIVAFFLFGGALMFFNVSAYLFKTGVNDIVGEARIAAQAAAEEIERSRGMRAAIDVLERRFENNEARYPGLSLALVPRANEIGQPRGRRPGPGARRRMGSTWIRPRPSPRG